MKIKTKELSYDEIMRLPRPARQLPKKPSRILSWVMHLASASDLKDVGFTYTTKRMEEAGDGPWMILMNHCSFLDLEMVSKIMYPKTYNIVCTSDGFVGKEWLMRHLGGIPTQKFVTDIGLLSDISHAIKVNKSSVLMYPEATYSFDGRTTALPRRMGVFLKRIGAPVVVITSEGSFTRDPLYNNLQKRKVRASATVECLFSAQELKSASVAEIDAALDAAFDLDYFKWQKDNGVRTDEPFRADGLNRILFKCAECGSEGFMEGSGTMLRCKKCGKEYEMDEYGCLHAKQGDTRFEHIPDWYDWERSEVCRAIEDGTYSLEVPVDIALMVDFKAIYKAGSGVLRHGREGFVLDGCDGKLHYEQSAGAGYNVYSDYFWYEIGDIICIGNSECLYYCFPKEGDVVAKTRIAVEELYKRLHSKRTSATSF